MLLHQSVERDFEELMFMIARLYKGEPKKAESKKAEPKKEAKDAPKPKKEAKPKEEKKVT